MKKLLSVAIAGFLALATVTSPSQALAQRGGGAGGGRGGMMGGMMGRGMMGGGANDSLLSILAIDEVREELKLDDEQVKVLKDHQTKIREASPDMRAMMQEIGGGNFREMSQPDREAAGEKMRSAMESAQEKVKEAMKKAEGSLVDLLDPDQYERLLGLTLQKMGVMGAASVDALAEELDITETQKSKFKELAEENMAKIREAMETAREERSFENVREKMEEMRKDLEEKSLKVLTADQQAKMEEMKGEKFEFPERNWQGRGGAGGRGAGGRGAGARGGAGGGNADAGQTRRGGRARGGDGQ
jgi:Spy/CpxP family protein refolding chaperone